MQILPRAGDTLTNTREHELALNIFPKTHTCWNAPAHFALPNILQTQFNWYDCRFPKYCVCFSVHELKRSCRTSEEVKVTSRIMWPGPALLSYCSRNQIIGVFCISLFSLHHYFHHAWFCQQQPCGAWGGGGRSLMSKQENDLYLIRQRKKLCSKAATFSKEQQVAMFTVMQENRCIL